MDRYARQIKLANIGISGQKTLKKAKVLVVGAGGLGSPVLYYLTSAGVGNIAVCDADKVEISNLNRQIIHRESSIGIQKTTSARSTLTALNTEVNIEEISDYLTAENAGEIVKKYDFIVDATDNFKSRYVINDACIDAHRPYAHGSIEGFSGQAFTHIPGSACYRCIFGTEERGENTEKPGVIGATAGVIGSIEAMECLKYLLQTGDLLTNKLLLFDGLTMEINVLSVIQNPNCHCKL